MFDLRSFAKTNRAQRDFPHPLLGVRTQPQSAMTCLMDNSEILKVLNDLTETAKDGTEGYRLAAESTEDLDLQSIFTNFSQQRQAFVSELEGLAAAHGGEADESGSVAGSLHRGWLNLKQAISSNDRAAILSECQRGDEHAVESYEDAINTPVPESVVAILRQQLTEIRSALEKVAHLADLGKAAG